jgi:hypothetical protein
VECRAAALSNPNSAAYCLHACRQLRQAGTKAEADAAAAAGLPAGPVERPIKKWKFLQVSTG